MKRRPCWCPKIILWELDSFPMQKRSFVPINSHRRFKKCRNKAFFHMRCRRTGEIGPKRKIVHFVSTCSRSGKKKLKSFYYFSRLHLHFPGFFQVWKIAGQMSRLFQELLKDSVRTLILISQNWSRI